MTLKQIFQMESIPCVHLHDILKRLLAKNCFDVSLMCLYRFVAFCVTFNDLCCWTQRCGLLSRIHLKLMDQSWQTGSKNFVWHFEVVFVVCWYQIESLIQVVYITFSLTWLKLQNFLPLVCTIMTLKQILQLESILCVYLKKILKRLFA